MTYEVRAVADDAELAELHRAAGAWDPAAQCNAAHPRPPLEQMLRAHRVYVASLEGKPVAFVLCSERRMIWLTGQPEHLGPACAGIAKVIHAEFAPAWGQVGNRQLRAAVVAASAGQIVDDRGTLRWVGTSG